MQESESKAGTWSAVRKLQAAGAKLEKREDNHGETRIGWWLDGVYLGSKAAEAMEAING